MTVSRNVTNIINWILDNLIPPIARDSKIFVYPLFWLVFGNKTKFFMEFKNKIGGMTEEEINAYYRNLSDVHINRETDLNNQSIKFILENITGEKILDIACGRGYLAKKIVEKYNVEVTGIDFNLPQKLKQSENPLFYEESIENIHYPDNTFDTVICTHTLEHVVNIRDAIQELRRVCKKRLIVILPRQREYKYTMDLHVHFFPYRYSVLNLFENHYGKCICLNNDWVYTEEINQS